MAKTLRPSSASHSADGSELHGGRSCNHRAPATVAGQLKAGEDLGDTALAARAGRALETRDGELTEYSRSTVSLIRWKHGSKILTTVKHIWDFESKKGR